MREHHGTREREKASVRERQREAGARDSSLRENPECRAQVMYSDKLSAVIHVADKSDPVSEAYLATFKKVGHIMPETESMNWLQTASETQQVRHGQRVRHRHRVKHTASETQKMSELDRVSEGGNGSEAGCRSLLR